MGIDDLGHESNKKYRDNKVVIGLPCMVKQEKYDSSQNAQICGDHQSFI
jgi:hypothetical protein